MIDFKDNKQIIGILYMLVAVSLVVGIFIFYITRNKDDKNVVQEPYIYNESTNEIFVPKNLSNSEDDVKEYNRMIDEIKEKYPNATIITDESGAVNGKGQEILDEEKRLYEERKKKEQELINNGGYEGPNPEEIDKMEDKERPL